jgi:predicted transcriptional regulator
MVPCLDGGLSPGDQPIDQPGDQSLHRSMHQSMHQSLQQSTHQSKTQIAALQSWLEQRLAGLEGVGAFEEAYALRMEMADWLLAEAG